MYDELFDAAKRARQRAYAPYSNFLVGAALLDEHGNMYAGCNVENVAYADTLCAESGAISAMVAGGGRQIRTIAIVGGKTANTLTCMPCGSCRQRIREFATSDTRIVTIDVHSGEALVYSIQDLLPLAYESNAT